MPTHVMRFEQFYYASVVFGLINSVLQFDRLSAQFGATMVLGTQAFVLFVLILLVWLVARRRQNWAKWTVLVLLILGLPTTVLEIFHMFRTDALVGVITSVQIVLQVLAVYFVFTGDAKEWFRSTARAI